MLYRHLATKGFDWGLVSKSIILDNSSVFTRLESRYGKIDRLDYVGEVLKSFSDKVSLNTKLAPIRDLIASNESLSSIIIDDTEIRSLSGVFSSEGATEIIASVEGQLKKVAVEMFSSTNPLTNDKDVFSVDKYASCIPLVVLTGTLPPQLDEENNSYFNPNGCVTVAEFLDSLNAIKFGSNSFQNRRKSLDNISDEKDFFNEGYQSCVTRFSSPFYNLYTRAELLNPITRVELAYITVFCWSEFSKRFDSVFTGEYSLGININWDNIKDVLINFEDGFDYKVSKRLLDDNKVLSINIKDYLSNGSMIDLLTRVKEGVSPIPYPMFMCLLELNALNVFYFENFRLDPLKEVSRGELAYFLVRLASIFGGNIND